MPGGVEPDANGITQRRSAPNRSSSNQVQQNPEAIALVFEDQRLTYAELNARANQLAHYLQQAGARPDDLVGICMERSLDMIVSLLGVLKAGSGYLPLDPQLSAERIAWMVKHSRAAITLTNSRLAGNLDLAGCRIVSIDTGWQEIAQYPSENLPSSVLPENTAYTIYTSGSTGTPKGVVIPQRTLCNHIYWAGRLLKSNRGMAFCRWRT